MNTTSLVHFLPLLLGSGAVTFTLLYVLLHTPIADFFTDKPDQRKIHHQPIPRIGGVAVIFSFLLFFSLLAFVPPFAIHFPASSSGLLNVIAIASLSILALGFFDDTTFVKVRVRHKLLVESAVAFVTVYVFSVNFGEISLLGVASLPLWVSNIVSFLWIIGLANAFNLIDGLDGLAGTIAIIALATLAAVALLFGQMGIALVTLLVAGATAGFLLLNLPPAKTFMGDTGAIFLGTVIAILCMEISSRCLPDKALFTVPLIAGIPIIEVLVTMVRRFCKSRDRKMPIASCLHSMVLPDNLHIHHRLLYKGYSAAQSVGILAIVAVTLGFGAVCIVVADARLILPVLLYLLVPVTFLLYQLDFGGRFSKALHLSPSRYNGLVKPSLIGIIDCEGSFSEKLERKNIDGVSYIKITATELHDVYQHLRAAVVREVSADPAALIKKAEAYSSLLRGPVYVINDTDTAEFRVREVSKNGSLVINEKIDSINNILKDFRKLSYTSRLYHHVTAPLQETKSDN